MSDEKRGEFFAKLICGGGAAVVGILALCGGVSALSYATGFEAVFLLVLGMGLGVLFLRLAWTTFGE